MGVTTDHFTYNDDHLVSSISTDLSGGLSGSLSVTFTYNADHLLSTSTTDAGMVYTNFYNDSKLLVRTDLSSDGTLAERRDYVYNATNQLITKTSTYFDGSGLVSVDSLEYSTETSINPTAINHMGSNATRTTYDYDTKHNPMALTGLLTIGSPNNITREGLTHFAYQYNESGYPVSMESNEGVRVTWTYLSCK